MTDAILYSGTDYASIWAMRAWLWLPRTASLPLPVTCDA